MSRSVRPGEIPSYGSASDPHRDGMIHKLLGENKELRAQLTQMHDLARAARVEIRRVERAGVVTMTDVYAIGNALDGIE